MSSYYTCKLFTFQRRTRSPTTSVSPYPRSGHRIVCDDGNLYSYGGFNPAELNIQNDEVWSLSKPLFKELWKYNFATKVWKKLKCYENMPNELVSMAVVLAPSGAMLIFGGTGVPFGAACSNRLYVSNLRDNVQFIDVEGQLPKSMYGQAMVLDTDGRYLYAVGGTTGFEYFTDVHCLDVRSKKWEEIYTCTGMKPCEPPGRYRHELGFYGGKIFVLGGGTAATVFGFQQIPVFNICTRQWEQVDSQPDPLASSPDFPAPRRCHAAVQMDINGTKGSCVFICGGFNGTEAFQDVWKLELNSLQWTHLKCKMPRPVFFHSAALTPAGQMYVFGGIEKHNEVEKRTAAVYSLWLRIPTLSDMCWEAIVHYTPNLHLHPRDQLLQHGIPLKYVDRI